MGLKTSCHSHARPRSRIRRMGSGCATPAHCHRSHEPARAENRAKKISSVLTVYDSPELTHTYRVMADGHIRLPMIKTTIPVEGLLPDDVSTLIADELKREQLLVDPFVTVTVVEYTAVRSALPAPSERPLSSRRSARYICSTLLPKPEARPHRRAWGRDYRHAPQRRRRCPIHPAHPAASAL